SEESRLTGSLQAAGNFTKCRSATYAMLQEGNKKCPYKHCSIGSTFTPDLQGHFLATSNFYYTSMFFELDEKDWLAEMIPAGKSLGFALDDGRIEFASKAGEKDIPLEWALGAFILKTSSATFDYADLSRKMLG
ncbi:unnamed protein product, partial [Brassica rapa]